LSFFTKIRLFLNRIITKNQTEDEYYYDLFVLNKDWSTKRLNTDEASRLKAILGLYKNLNITIKTPNIIDVGAGRGWLGGYFSNIANVDAIEPVSSVVEHGKKLYPAVTFYAMHPEHYLKKYPKKKFDILLCSEVLEHVIDKTGFVAVLSKFVKKGGYALISTPRKELYKQWAKKNGLPPQPVEEWITTDECLELFSLNNFRHIDTKNTFDMDIYQIHSFKKIR
jgi:2-polyprenyl-3-methyl-5-hydroxy-6-metoxy-1,4-benzoquinol methylase